VQAFKKSAEIVPDEDINLLAGLVKAMISNENRFQTEMQEIVSGLMDRVSKIPGSN
jgi:hypothetical protein